MKNIKSIIYVCLAAVLILGVTACQEPQVYKVPAGLVANVTKTNYIVGEDFDPSTLSAVVTYTDGSTKTFNGTQLKYTLSDGSDDITDGKVAANTIVEVSYAGVSNKASFTAYTVSSVTLANLPTTASWDGKKATVDPDGITVTATLSNNTTRELTAREYDLTLTPTKTSGSVTAGDKDVPVVVSAEVYGTGVSLVNGIDDWTVDVGTQDFNDESESFTLKVDEKLDGVAYNPASDTAYFGQVLTWEIYVEDKDGGKKVLTSNDYWVQNNETLPSSVTIGRDTVDKTYTIILKEDLSKTATITVKAGVNYVTDVVLNGYVEGKAPTAAGQTIQLNEQTISCTPVYKVTYDKEKDSAIEWTVSSSTVSAIDSLTTVAGEPFAPQILLSWEGVGGKTVTKGVTLPSVNIE